ncbi:multidrug effflux MFS transporter [Pseudomonas sp. SZMC_28357]|uniref:multidrug effflux MFS transporter n=1 Tax=Pseudomonas sp. SZMC_28357 TaxID=3074380 RepID=UPI002870EB9E|nr:multidrug effflux MFS transporter [Pseudomonas sp. SZMC_28357]MDR9750814.1 multidrug effflux MFS transporter [Pseudomonas sp. SZMC_28357]
MDNSPGQRRIAVILLLSMSVLGVFPLDVVLPSFPALAEHYRTAPADIALSVSLFAVGVALSQWLIGPLSDVVGRKHLLLAGMATAMVGAVGCTLATDYPVFLAMRFVQALGCGCFVLSQALVQDLFDGEQRNRLRILLVTATGVCISVSPLVGTALQSTLDWPGSFLLFAALALVVLLSASVFLDNPRPATNATRPALFKAYRRVCGDFDFVAYWLISAFAFACHFSFIVTSPLMFMERLQLSGYDFSLILLIYGAAYVFGGLVAAVLNRRMRPSQQITLGLSMILLSGMVMLLFSTLLPLSVTSVLIPMLICTTGTTIARPAATTQAMGLFPDNAGTAASAGSTLIFICGGLISAIVSLSSIELASTLGFSFIALSGAALVLNHRINRRAEGRRARTTSE